MLITDYDNKYICINNKFGFSVSLYRSSAVFFIYDRKVSF